MRKDKLDLHGVRHRDVPRKVDAFLGEMIDSKLPELTIVTGVSVDMQNIVINTLKDYNLDYEIGDIYNPGYIKINLI
jgi:hypothetical protein